MVIDRPIERMTLRQLLTQAGKLSNEISQGVYGTYLPKVADLHEMSRPTRRKSQYPAVFALQNSLTRFSDSSKKLLDLMASLNDHLQAIQSQASHEHQSRR